jgi:hypothetical protein
MPEQIIKDRAVEALKAAAGWPGADRATIVILATVLAATGADAEGSSYFGALAADQPGQPLPLALAGYFQVRAGQDITAGLAKLDDAASRDLGLPQYYRGLALAGLPPEAGQAARAVDDLEFVLAVRDQFPAWMIRAVHHGLAAAHAALGHEDRAAEAAANSGLAAAPPGARLEFSGSWVNAADGFHFSSPRIIEPAPGVRVAQGYDFGDFAFLTTEAGVVAIDAGTAEQRVRAALRDAGLQASQVSHVILTHSHFDHAGGIGALLRPGTRVIAQAGFPAELERQHANPLPFRYFTGSGAGFGDGRPAEPAAIPAAAAPPAHWLLAGRRARAGAHRPGPAGRRARPAGRRQAGSVRRGGQGPAGAAGSRAGPGSRHRWAGPPPRCRAAGAAASAGALPPDGATPAAGPVPVPDLRRDGRRGDRPCGLR